MENEPNNSKKVSLSEEDLKHEAPLSRGRNHVMAISVVIFGGLLLTFGAFTAGLNLGKNQESVKQDKLNQSIQVQSQTGTEENDVKIIGDEQVPEGDSRIEFLPVTTPSSTVVPSPAKVSLKNNQFTSKTVSNAWRRFRVTYPENWKLNERLANPGTMDSESMIYELTNNFQETIRFLQVSAPPSTCLDSRVEANKRFEGGGMLVEGEGIMLEKKKTWRVFQLINKIDPSFYFVCEGSVQEFGSTSTVIGMIEMNIRSEKSLSEAISILESLEIL